MAVFKNVWIIVIKETGTRLMTWCTILSPQWLHTNLNLGGSDENSDSIVSWIQFSLTWRMQLVWKTSTWHSWNQSFSSMYESMDRASKFILRIFRVGQSESKILHFVQQSVRTLERGSIKWSAGSSWWFIQLKQLAWEFGKLSSLLILYQVNSYFGPKCIATKQKLLSSPSRKSKVPKSQSQDQKDLGWH